MKSDRLRLDVLLVERGLAESREKAQRLIRAGLVHTQNERLDKPGRLVHADTEIMLKGTDCPYVSRGGLKLAGALDAFHIDPKGCVAVDLGASTGGFTDCLLQRGADRVHAIDVGRGQLHERLQRDPRVFARERTHMDALQSTDFEPPPTLCVADLSFISLRRAFPVMHRILSPGGIAIALVKPQFEAGRELVPRGGVISDERLQRQIVDSLRSAALEQGFQVVGEASSPILGGDGNREFFLHLVR
ncbi:TlyA family RNA methyltransferase [Candidatus Sumerlaeota bacterium]|nr:TlyA family RNA methyltransferase [Candidatus Sumerlaeota bacterium]